MVFMEVIEMSIIETRELRKSYRSPQGKDRKAQMVEAVKGIDLQVHEGEIFGFLGPNGAGKTTTLRMLSTLIPPTSGQAFIAGYDLIKESAQVRKNIGYVSQAGGTDFTATARENLMLQARLYGMSRRTAEVRVKELIAILELEPFADRVAKTYSGGQRRRLDLALGMVHRPRLLFLDEPTTGLDPQSRARLWEEVRKQQENGMTVFLTTHYLEEADILADRLAIIDDGSIVVEGTSQSLKQQIAGDVVTLGLETHNGQIQQALNLLRSQPFVRELHHGDGQLQLYVERGEESLPAILRVLDSANLNARTVALARPSLDDVFLRQTGRSLREAST
jgi:ABC-2 type transport system ATP-binding protein